jgi:adenosylcobinamide-phosphate synthase
MNLDYQIILAVCLDLAVGDPRWLPHPVRFIGEYASWLETPTRRLVPGLRLAGITTVFLVLSATALVSVVLVYGGAAVTPALGVLMSIILMYTGIAGRDLILHSRSVRSQCRTGICPLQLRESA